MKNQINQKKKNELKKLILLILIGALLQVNVQISSFEMGYGDGYCKTKEEDKDRVPCGILPKATFNVKQISI